MCRSIKPLFNFSPPATDDEIHEAALQFVRKISGFPHPSAANTEAFDQAVENITDTSRQLLQSLTTNAATRNREKEKEKAKMKALKRFGRY